MYKVTREHINLGVKNSRFNCPIALCLREVNGEDVLVGSDTLCSNAPLSDYAKEHPKKKTYMLSESIADWIKDYDRGERVLELTLEAHGMYIHQEGEPYG